MLFLASRFQRADTRVGNARTVNVIRLAENQRSREWTAPVNALREAGAYSGYYRILF